MSEVKLNLIDGNFIFTGNIHGSVVERCNAALSAEPETIPELEAALRRYERNADFPCFRKLTEIDYEPWDAGLVIIDLAARVICTESTYNLPSYEGEVTYHDGHCATDVSIPFRIPEDWRFVNSVEAYRWSSDRRRMERLSNPPIDTRAVLFGRPLLEFLVAQGVSLRKAVAQNSGCDSQVAQTSVCDSVVDIHRNWLITPRPDLRGKSPRHVLLEKQDFIDFDLHTRSLQWSCLGEGPPCLAADSFAFRFGGFGTHEWVIYYYLVRQLIREVAQTSVCGEDLIQFLEQFKTEWLDTPEPEYYGRSPANIIHNERRRLPETMTAKEVIIDDDCECCRMLARDVEMGYGPSFWHLDGCNMEDEFAFSHFLTEREWQAHEREMEEMQMRWAHEDEQRRQLNRMALDDSDDNPFKIELDDFEFLNSNEDEIEPEPC